MKRTSLASLFALAVPAPGAVASTALTGPVELTDAQLDAVTGAGVRGRPDAFGVKTQGDPFGQKPTEPTT